MKFGYTIFYVEDVSKTIEFYENAFSLKRKFIHESNEYGELSTGETTLSFASLNMAKMNDIGFDESKRMKNPTDVEIGLVTSEVQSAFDHAVKSGAVSVKKPVQKPWGQTVGYVRDNNGFLIEICSPIG